MKTYKRTLTIAGSDSGGGAGIQADIKTISACCCFATSAITAITAQNTEDVFAIHAIPPEIVEKQIQVVIDDIGTDSVKIGMLNNSETTVAVKRALSKYDINKIGRCCNTNTYRATVSAMSSYYTQYSRSRTATWQKNNESGGVSRHCKRIGRKIQLVSLS
jgi:phosphoribosyl-AMP cyclohydrolase